MAISHVPPGLSWGALILAGLSGMGTLYMEFNRNDRSLTERVSALEAHKDDSARQIDHIQEQVDKLVQWAIGNK